MRPDQGDHPTHGPHHRPGGGTYPVRAAVTAPPPEPAPAEPPLPPLQPRQVVSPYKHTSPRSFLLLLLMAIGLVTLVLLAFAVSGYLPRGAEDREAVPAPTENTAPES